jgi:hypothetical protein
VPQASRKISRQAWHSHPEQYAQFKFCAAGAISPFGLPAGCRQVVLPHFQEAGAAREAVDQAKHCPHDRTPLLTIDGRDLGVVRFPGFFARLQK